MKGKKKRCRRVKESRSIMKLTDDVIIEILTRLPASCVLKFRRVCKSWSSLTAEQSFIRAHTRRLCDGPNSMVLHPSPFVVSPHPLLQQHLCRVDTDSNNDNRLVERSIDIRSMIPDHYAGMELFMRAACDGLLCFAVPEGPDAYFICNPITRTWTTVAASPNQSPNRTGVCLRAIYFHRPTGEYRLLQHFSNGGSVGYEVVTVNVGAKWRTVRRILDPNSTEMDWVLAENLNWYGPIVTKGSLHWLDPYHHLSSGFGIIVFDTEAEEFRQMTVPVDSKPQKSGQINLLYEIRGNLCVALRRYVNPRRQRETELWLLEDYGSQRWVKMRTMISEKGIYDRSKYYSSSSSTTTPPTADFEEGGKLLVRWGLISNQFSLYNFKLKTSSHIRIKREISFSIFSQDYVESLLMV